MFASAVHSTSPARREDGAIKSVMEDRVVSRVSFIESGCSDEMDRRQAFKVRCNSAAGLNRGKLPRREFVASASSKPFALGSGFASK